MNSQSGKLYVVSLPIGNIRDVTLRALDVFREVDYIAAEDTREMVKFLRLHELPHKELISYREQVHDKASAQIIDLLTGGSGVAIVSDRGTPGVSDPGTRLVSDAIAAGIEVVSVPGPSSAIAALTISGLPTDTFTFLGFLPRTAGKQKRILESFAELDTTLIIFESPFRVVKLLENIIEALGPDVQVAAAHEVTKLNEGVVRGSAAEVHAEISSWKGVKGEWVVMVR